MTDEKNRAGDVMLPPELLSAFPVGGLAFLAGIATVLAAEHGALATRELFTTLAATDSFWNELRARFEPAPLEARFEAASAEPAEAAARASAKPNARPRRTNGTV